MRISRRSLRVVQFRRLLELSRIFEVPHVTPRAVEIHGNRMDTATGVELNRMSAPDFAVISPQRILVQVPTSVRGTISEAAVFADMLGPGDKAQAFYDIGTYPRALEGKGRVLQNFVKLLLTTPGTDIWSQNSGAGLRGLQSTALKEGENTALSGDVESRILNATRQIIRAQAADPAIPRGERVLSVNTDQVEVSVPQQALNISISMSFHDGASVKAAFSW